MERVRWRVRNVVERPSKTLVLSLNLQSIAFYLSNSRSSIRSECDTVEFIDVATGSISATNYDQSNYNYKLPFQSVNDIAISSTNLYRDKNSFRYKYNTF